MAAAYATFASGGMYAEPYGIKTIRDNRGRIVYQHEPHPRRAFETNQVGVLNGALQRVVGEGTGRAAGIGRPVAGKTGTTSDNRDAWFVGYTPQVATAVWVGYDPAQPMSNVHGRSVTGGSFPAAIFGDLMRTGLAGVPVRGLPLASPDSLRLHRLGDIPAPPAPPPLEATPLPPPDPTPDVPELQLVVPPPPAPTDASSTTTTTRPAPTTTATSATTTTTAPPRSTSSTTTTTAPSKTTTSSTTR
jgi:membrane peptidoglycan carboxypeptidase